ncbi:MAG: Branched-chain amino acid transport ATP-binding protein LivF [uncultured Thermomicrobiales bacterium]|uniref:Branched-chain amino acid transport ATP-binding protein LivF n=1 Tax=uncultured Thermomicrobiales bacterium TaxID=1645740 RepID=A0A6J4VRR4_9BACT|nr:MAG: Branched-chain amino acid transport ATP-binding protein LivF [uncultured Thermomicrobiales bacterium]
MPDALLAVDNLSAWYGEAQALRDITVTVREGETVTLVGRNGAGKTTTLRCLIGLHRQARGRIALGGREIATLAPHRRARLGLGYVPDDRGIYATLSVEENLLLPPTVGPDPWSLDRIYAAFPRLRERRRANGTTLSGGEQQMLAIARVLRMGARLLLLDEPTEGLAPVLVQQLEALLLEAKRQGVAMLLIEQNLRFATAVADRHYLLALGQIVDELTSEQVRERSHQILEHMGV